MIYNLNRCFMVKRDLVMNEQSTKNKKAWEYRAYEFWNIRKELQNGDVAYKEFYREDERKDFHDV